MSARFYKIFAVVLAAHIGVFSLVLVGFSAPLSRPPASFIYSGSLPVEDTGSVKEDWPKENSGQITVDPIKESNMNQWIKIRDSQKPEH